MGTNTSKLCGRDEMDRANGDPRRPAGRRCVRCELGDPTQSSVCCGDERAELRKHCPVGLPHPGKRRMKQPGKDVTQRGRCEHEQSCGSRRRGWRDQNDYRRGHNYHVHDTRRPFSPMLPMVSAPAEGMLEGSIMVVRTVDECSSSVAIVSICHSLSIRPHEDGTGRRTCPPHRCYQLPLHGPGHSLHRLAIDRARAQSFTTQKRTSGCM